MTSFGSKIKIVEYNKIKWNMKNEISKCIGWKKTFNIPDGFYWISRENLPTVISFWFGKQSGLPEWYLLATSIYLWPWHLWKTTEISFLTETWTLQILSSFSMKWQRNMMEKLFCQLPGTGPNSILFTITRNIPILIWYYGGQPTEWFNHWIILFFRLTNF